VGLRRVPILDTVWQNEQRLLQYTLSDYELVTGVFRMKRIVLVLVALLMVSGSALAQDDDCSGNTIQRALNPYMPAGGFSLLDHSPDVLSEMLEDMIADLQAVKDGCDRIVADASVQETEPLDAFNVVATGAVNVRDCADTSCERLGTTEAGQVLKVVGQADDWYEIEWATGTAFIASWLTERGPDNYVDLYEPYLDVSTGCVLLLSTDRGDNDLDVIITGARLGNVWVDVYRPNEANPMRVDSQYDKTFIDTGDVYILQTYNWRTYWPNGVYQVEVSVGNASSITAFDIKASGSHQVWVMCD
jgi:hypothetical protein